jgi:hypothetical protein
MATKRFIVTRPALHLYKRSVKLPLRLFVHTHRSA